MSKWYLDYNAVPPADDENDYVWDTVLRRWVIDPPFYDIDEAAMERAETRRQKRAQWDTYHPGEICPQSELD